MLDNSCLFCLLKAMPQNYSAFLKKVVTDYFGLVLRGLPEVSKIVFYTCTHTIPLESLLFRQNTMTVIHLNFSRQQAT